MDALDVVAPFLFSHQKAKLSRGKTWWTTSPAALCEHVRTICEGDVLLLAALLTESNKRFVFIYLHSTTAKMRACIITVRLQLRDENSSLFREE